MICNPILYNDKGQGLDALSLNLQNRNVMLVGPITDDLATMVISQLLYLDSVGGEPIQLYINSPGGCVSAGLAIYDTMKSLRNEVWTVCMGQAASMAAVLFSGGEKTHRYVLPHSEVMIHQPSGGINGQATDIVIAADHIKELRSELNKLLAENCGKSMEEIRDKMERDFWMNAEMAIAFGIADEIVCKRAC